MVTGDDFNYPELIAGDDQGFIHALLGIFDPLAPPAAAAVGRLGQGDAAGFRAILDPTAPLAREIGTRAAAIGAQARAAGVAVAGLCRAPFLVGPLAAPDRAAVMGEVRAAIDMAAGLGAPVLTLVAGGVEPGTRGVAESLARLADGVAEAAPHAAACGVRLVLEPLNPVYGGDRSCLVTLRDALDLCDRIGAANVGVAVDVYHV